MILPILNDVNHFRSERCMNGLCSEIKSEAQIDSSRGKVIADRILIIGDGFDPGIGSRILNF